MSFVKAKMVLGIGIVALLGAIGASALAAPGGAADLLVSGAGDAQPLSVSPAAVGEYKRKCLVCHGAAGKGDGPGAAALNPKPRSFRDRGWQDSVTDAQIRKATVEGGVAVGKSSGMPAHPHLKKTPQVVEGLMALIRSFKD